jgi:hypothetical protein
LSLVRELLALAVVVDLMVGLVRPFGEARVALEPVVLGLIGGFEGSEEVDDALELLGESVRFGLGVTVPGLRGGVQRAFGVSFVPDGQVVFDEPERGLPGMFDGSGVLGAGVGQPPRPACAPSHPR